MSGPITLVLPLPPNMANGRFHWRTKDRLRKVYCAEADRRQAAGLLPKPPAKPLERVTLDVVMHLASRMDHDNAAARCKFAVDWLKTRGYIVDDSPKHLSWVSFPEQRVKRDGNYRLELTLVPV